MIFKVPALREEIRSPLHMYIGNRDYLPTQLLFRKGGKMVRLLLGWGEDCELNLESCELVEDQIMR